MVHHKQPKSLYQLCHHWFSDYLGSRVATANSEGVATQRSNQTLSNVRLKLRPFFVEHIPAVVRTSLLQETGDLLFQRSLLSGVDCDYGRQGDQEGKISLCNCLFLSLLDLCCTCCTFC